MPAPASRSQQGRQDELAQTLTKLEKAEKLVSRQSWINDKNCSLEIPAGGAEGRLVQSCKKQSKMQILILKKRKHRPHQPQ